MCRQPRGGRAFYTTSDSVEDIEAVRKLVGVDRVSFYAVSYGTKVALSYALRYPQHVERLVLDSVVRPEGPDPLRLSTFAAVPRVLRTLCRGACAFTRDPAADLAALVKRLARGAARGSIVTGDGRRHPARLDRVDLVEILVAGDRQRRLRPAFPAAVHSALRGDFAPMLRLKRRASPPSASVPPDQFSAALFVATYCEDAQLPWARGTPSSLRLGEARRFAGSLSDAVFAPFDRATALAGAVLSICLEWPALSPAGPPATSGLPDVPALILTGEDDVRTPLEDAAAIARMLPRAQLLRVPGVGHSVLSGSECAFHAVTRFFDDDAVEPCRRNSIARPKEPVPFVLAALPPAGRLHGTRGRMLTALRLTLSDVLDEADWVLSVSSDPVRGGGLRGGRFEATPTSLTLERVVYVPKVAVSARLRGTVEPHAGRVTGATGTVTITGPGGLAGRFVLRGAMLTGTIGGKRVRTRMEISP